MQMTFEFLKRNTNRIPVYMDTFLQTTTTSTGVVAAAPAFATTAAYGVVALTLMTFAHTTFIIHIIIHNLMVVLLKG